MYRVLILSIFISSMPLNTLTSQSYRTLLNNAKSVYSDTAFEIINWYGLKSTTHSYHHDSIVIRSNKELKEFLAINDPLTVKFINIINDNSKESIILDLSIFKNLEFLQLKNFPTIPTGFYTLKKLKVLVILFGSDGKLENEFTSLTELEYLEIVGSRLKLPDGIYKLKELNTLKCAYCFQSDSAYSDIFRLPKLEVLQVKFRNIEQMKGISKLKHLRILVTNQISSEVSELSIKGLYLRDVNIEYPTELLKLNTLVAFRWEGNYKSEVVPIFVASSKNLEYIKFHECTKFKKIPLIFDSLENLKEFIISSRPRKEYEVTHLKRIKGKITII